MYLTFLMLSAMLFGAPSAVDASFSSQSRFAQPAVVATVKATSSAPVLTTQRTRFERHRRASAFDAQKYASQKHQVALQATSTKVDTKLPQGATVKPLPAATATGDTSTSAPTPSTSVIPLSEQIARAVIERMNTHRTTAGLPTLKSQPLIADVAAAHSADMHARSFFSHTNPDNCSSSCRLSAAGYAWRASGENIYWMSGRSLEVSSAAERIVESWMNSAGHRANILGKQFTEAGVGIHISGDKLYATAAFATPK